MLWTHLTSFSVLQILLRQDSQEKKKSEWNEHKFPGYWQWQKKGRYINNTWYYFFLDSKNKKISLIMMRWFYPQSSLKKSEKKNNKNKGTVVLKNNSGQFRSVMQIVFSFWKRNTISLRFHHSRLKYTTIYKHKISNYMVSYH